MASLPPVRDVRDLLALIHYELGFPPLRSVVLVPFGGPAHASAPLVRLDLDLLDAAAATGAQAEAARDVLAEVLAHVRRRGAREAVVLVIADGPACQAGEVRSAPPADDVALAARVGAQVEQAGVRCRPLLVVRQGRWRSLTPTTSGRVGEEPWEDVGDVTVSPVSAAMIGAGSMLVADRAGLLPGLPDADPSSAGTPCGCPSPREASAWLSAWLDAVEVLRRNPRADVDAGELACLVGSMRDVTLRDAVLVSFVCPGPAVAREVLAAAGAVTAAGVAATRWRAAFDDGLRGGVPRDHVATCEALLERLMQARPWHRSEDGLAVLAWVAWWTGRGARAQVLAAEVLRRRPGHRLARLTSDMVGALVPPPWVEAA